MVRADATFWVSNDRLQWPVFFWAEYLAQLALGYSRRAGLASRASSTGFGVASASFPRAVREDALTDCAAVAVALSGVLDSEPLTANEPLRPLQTSPLISSC